MTSPPGPGPTHSRRLLVADASALLVLALVVNSVRIGAHSIGLDEASSIHIANSGWRDLVGTVSSGANMSVYYVLLTGWVRVFGESEPALRSLSAISAALAVPALYLLGSRLSGRMAGLTAGILLALNAFMVQFAQTARSYALVVLLVTLSSWFFVRELERPGKWNRVGYVLASSLAFGAHFFAVTVLAAQALTLLAVRRSQAFTRAWLGMGAAIAMLCAPTVWRASRGNAADAIDWIQRPTAADIGSLLVQLAGRSTPLMFALLALGGIALISTLRRKPAWPVAFVAAWFAVPILMSFAVSMLKPVFVSYYLIVCLPAFLLLGAMGIARLRPRAVGAVVASLMAMLSGSRVAAHYGREASENWRGATQYVLAEQRPGDAIVFFPQYAPASFAYYVRRHGTAGPTHAGRFPSSGNARVWLAIRASDSTGQRAGLEQLRQALDERYHLEKSRAFRGVAIERYVRSAAR